MKAAVILTAINSVVTNIENEPRLMGILGEIINTIQSVRKNNEEVNREHAEGAQKWLP